MPPKIFKIELSFSFQLTTSLRVQGRVFVKDFNAVWRLFSDDDSADPRLELELIDICVTLDAFAAGLEKAWRVGLSVADVKVLYLHLPSPHPCRTP